MKLKELIDTLAALDPDDPIVFMDGQEPNGLCSWRGVYAELTIDSAADGRTNTVGKLLADAREAVGKTFTGYKGGEYVMTGDTPVWADPWGEYYCIAPSGFMRTQDKVRITTIDLSDYR